MLNLRPDLTPRRRTRKTTRLLLYSASSLSSIKNIIQASHEALQNLECFNKFSRYLSHIFRHSKLLHQNSLSLTLHEPLGPSQFVNHIIFKNAVATGVQVYPVMSLQRSAKSLRITLEWALYDIFFHVCLLSLTIRNLDFASLFVMTIMSETSQWRKIGSGPTCRQIRVWRS